MKFKRVKVNKFATIIVITTRLKMPEILQVRSTPKPNVFQISIIEPSIDISDILYLAELTIRFLIFLREKCVIGYASPFPWFIRNFDKKPDEDSNFKPFLSTFIITPTLFVDRPEAEKVLSEVRHKTDEFLYDENIDPLVLTCLHGNATNLQIWKPYSIIKILRWIKMRRQIPKTIETLGVNLMDVGIKNWKKYRD